MNQIQRLDEFRANVNLNLGLGALDVKLPVVDVKGGVPVVVALSDELLTVLMDRVTGVGGYANVFVSEDSSISLVAVIDARSALGAEDADDLASDEGRPGADATVGMFLSYLGMRPNGVRLPARGGGDRPFVPVPREVSLSH